MKLSFYYSIVVHFFRSHHRLRLLFAKQSKQATQMIIESNTNSFSDVGKWETVADATEWKHGVISLASAIDVIDDNMAVIYGTEKQRKTNRAFRCFLQT